MKPLHRLVIHAQEALSRALLGDLESTGPSVPSWEPLSNTWKSHPGIALPAHLVLQVPDPVLVGELLVAGAALGQDAALEAAHVEQQVGVVLAYTDTKLFSHCTVVTERGKRFLMSQNTARPLENKVCTGTLNNLPKEQLGKFSELP